LNKFRAALKTLHLLRQLHLKQKIKLFFPQKKQFNVPIMGLSCFFAL
jgi:hypothetical protein